MCDTEAEQAHFETMSESRCIECFRKILIMPRILRSGRQPFIVKLNGENEKVKMGFLSVV